MGSNAQNPLRRLLDATQWQSLQPIMPAASLGSPGAITTVEYQKITIYGTDKIKYIHPVELAQRWREYVEKFDFAISFSSIEHSGLGR
ncbi:hypothetical protein ANCCAN_13142 [Ancylostoma caninum]|uniref:Uncharacterized protein n=1 Tax=Ancylostoma caninum TaxID=29170 RepID=A0A368GDQ3_ANCCA|nr:hypothetical protein ANCCAN_13142 [Ancylostoma caninum]